MPKRIFLDNETIHPDRDDPTVQHKLAGCDEDEYRKFALDGEYGRLLCIGVIVEEDGQIIHRGVLGHDRETNRFHLDETRTLRGFWKLLKGFDERRDLLIGFNLLDFDLRFLCQRSMLKGIKPSVDLCFARFRKAPIFDVMWEFEFWKRRISLDELARVFGLASPKYEGVDGCQGFDLYLDGRHSEIADYCLRDVETTRQIFYRMRYEAPPKLTPTTARDTQRSQAVTP